MYIYNVCITICTSIYYTTVCSIVSFCVDFRLVCYVLVCMYIMYSMIYMTEESPHYKSTRMMQKGDSFVKIRKYEMRALAMVYNSMMVYDKIEEFFKRGASCVCFSRF